MSSMVTGGDTLRTLHSLRTVHGNFTDRPMGEEELQTILQASVRAANASARQSYSIVVVEDKAVMQELLGYQGAKALIYCVDFNRLADVAGHLGYDYDAGFNGNGLVDFLTGSMDTMLAAQTAAVAAKSLGIDSLFTNAVHRGDIGRIYRLLDLPEKKCFPLIGLVLGYAQGGSDHKKGRLCGKGVVHRGKYERLSPAEMDQLIADYDDPKTQLGLGVDWAKDGLAHYLDYFYGAWCGLPRKGQTATLRRPTDLQQLMTLLRRAGFLQS